MRAYQVLVSFELFCDRVVYRHQMLHVGQGTVANEDLTAARSGL